MYTITSLAVTLLLVLMISQPSSGQTECQAQCYQNYVQLIRSYCIWNVACTELWKSLARYYNDCYYNCECGIGRPSPKIFGGNNASVDQFPWQAAVERSDGSFCGGVIIDNMHVLTAAHCIKQPGVAYKVGVGSVNRWTALKNSYAVERITRHPGYNDSLNFVNDIALLTLSRPLNLSTPTVRAICLPTSGADVTRFNECTISGWGIDNLNKGAPVDYLQFVSVPILSDVDCSSRLGYQTGVERVCAGDIIKGGRDSCQGDSGGPLACYEGGRYVLYGLATYECYNQCFQTYRELLRNFCVWQQLCLQVSNVLSQFVTNCYATCNSPANSTIVKPVSHALMSLSQSAPASRCGVSQSPRIIGGIQALECEFPWVVSITINALTCGGVILDLNTVITAGHCVFSANRMVAPSSVTVLYGSSSQNFMKRATVSRVQIHPSFILSYFDYDVALLTLSSPLIFGKCVSPICLPTASADPTATDFCQTAGWGALLSNAPAKQTDLRVVNLPLVPLPQCQNAFQEARLISSIKICAGDLKKGGIDACLGDSGGPLMCMKNGFYTLNGIVSFGRGCAQPGYPGVYANVAHPNILNWIRKNI